MINQQSEKNKQLSTWAKIYASKFKLVQNKVEAGLVCSE
jgi:hypothetical protein